MENPITFGEYFHLKNQYEELKETSAAQLHYWEQECDKRQRVIDILRQSSHPTVTEEDIQAILDRLFPPAE